MFVISSRCHPDVCVCVYFRTKRTKSDVWKESVKHTVFYLMIIITIRLGSVENSMPAVGYIVRRAGNPGNDVKIRKRKINWYFSV